MNQLKRRFIYLGNQQFLKMFCYENWKVNGWWKLVYSTITILGSKRTKLGLRDFISLGDFLQIIDVEQVNLLSAFFFFFL